MKDSVVYRVILEFGGFTAFARRMGDSCCANLREIVAGNRVPRPATRRKIIAASDGRISEADILAIAGTDEMPTGPMYKVDPMWGIEDEEKRRDAIIRRAAAGARSDETRCGETWWMSTRAPQSSTMS